MMIDVKTRDEDGNIIFEGSLNRKEVGFLLQYSINDLMMAGVQFNLHEEDEGESRLKFPKEELND